MSEGIPYADIVILALVAGFIILRLRSVLGNKPDGEGADFFRKEPRPEQVAAPIIQVDAKTAKPKAREESDPFLSSLTDDGQIATLNAVKAADPMFTATEFVTGATRAYEMVFDAFNKGDKPTLKMLLSDELYTTFCKEIDARDETGERTETTLVSVKAEKMTEATLTKNTARIGLHFTTEQVTVVRDEKGTIVGGDASEIHYVEDSWLFERDITSRNPSWKIIET